MVVQLTDRQKIAIRLRMAQTPPDERVALIGIMRSSGEVPAEVVAFFESVNVEIRQAEARRSEGVRADHVYQSAPEIRRPSPEEVREFWLAAGRMSGGLFLVGSGVVVVAHVIIPAALAIGGAIVTAAPYLVGGFGGLLILKIFVSSFRRSPAPDGHEPEVITRTTTITEVFRP